MKKTIVVAVLFSMLGAVVASSVAQVIAASQNQLGFFLQGTLIPGHCVKVGTIANTLADAGVCITAPPPLAIGAPVGNSPAPNACLSTDVNGNLTQASCLTAQ